MDRRRLGRYGWLASLMAASAIAVAAGDIPDGVHWSIDTPSDGQAVPPIVWVTGWMLAEAGVARIDLEVDGSLLRSADIDEPRPDVLEAFPEFVGIVENPGFHVGFHADPAAGPRSVEIRLWVELLDGQLFALPARHVVVGSPQARPPWGHVESWPNGDTTGAFWVSGWALDAESHPTVAEIRLDGRLIASPIADAARPDVGSAFPYICGAERSGFGVVINEASLLPGSHWIAVTFVDADGNRSGQFSNEFQYFVGGSDTPPFGSSDLTYNLSIVHCSNAADPLANAKLFSGWLLDPSRVGEPAGIASIELTFDGTVIAATNTDCGPISEHYPELFDGRQLSWVNCFGLPTPWLAEQFVGFRGTENAGYRFLFDTSRLRPEPASGLHYLTIRSTDVNGQSSTVDSVPVLISIPPDCPEGFPVGWIDQPRGGVPMGEPLDVSGWAVDFDPIVRLDVTIDGQPFGSATYGLERPDVAEYLIIYPPSLARFSGFAGRIDVSSLEAGEHELVVYAEIAYRDRRAVAGCRFHLETDARSCSIGKPSSPQFKARPRLLAAP